MGRKGGQSQQREHEQGLKVMKCKASSGNENKTSLAMRRSSIK